MSDDAQFEPAALQVVSDFGQLRAFNDPQKIQILRILQRREATIEQLMSLIDAPVSAISEDVDVLLKLGLIRVVGQQDHASGESSYRAMARIYDLQPDADHNAVLMAPVANATLDSIRHDVVTSLTEWPDQRMNFESRRLRMSRARTMEFNDRFVELLAEFWGDPDHPVEEEPDEPVMAFAGIWYRFPEQD
jgi:DNA-binding transcriptional ArsR family regulator